MYQSEWLHAAATAEVSNRLPHPLPAVRHPPVTDCSHPLAVVDVKSVSDNGGNVLRCEECQISVGESFPRVDYKSA
jgi:hypothetical protein